MTQDAWRAREASSQLVDSAPALLTAAPARLAPRTYRVVPTGGAAPAAVYAAGGRAPGRLLLESAAPRPPLGRYSFVTGAPVLYLWHRAGRTFLQVAGRPAVWAWVGDPFVVLQALAARYAEAPGPAPTPFPAGLAGYLGYSLRRWIEPGPVRLPARPGLPDCWLGLYDSTCTFDHAAGTATLSGPADGAALDRWVRALERAAHGGPAPPPPAPVAAATVGRTFGPAGYQTAVETVQAAIRAGSVYQVNVSQRFVVPCADPGWTIYNRLRAANPAPFAAYLALPGASVISASPERFLRVTGTQVETR
ncbi:MAG TPA: chorismate-binding protein, partial [Chloroflexia bacterium]|nr:chorismate-binding protein [Chloroflexia bacterium]